MKKKYLQIFNFLKEFASVRAKTIRDISNSKAYPEILWFSDIPKNKLFRCILWNDIDDEVPENWLEISKPLEPEKPIFAHPPSKLMKWIDKDTLSNKDDFPSLFKEIENSEGEKLYIENYPEIKAEYDKYIDNKWFMDSENYWKKYENYKEKINEYNQLNAIYNKIFTIYNKSNQFGEEYELIIGLGLLYFKYDNSLIIKRHLLVGNADIEFDSTNAVFKVKNNVNGLNIRLETDMINDLKGFNTAIVNKETETLLNNSDFSETAFSEDIKEIIQKYTNEIEVNSKFIDGIQITNKITEHPIVYYSPAIILRKRKIDNFTDIYNKIIDQIQELDDETIIQGIDDLVNTESNNATTTDNSKNYKDNTIYFPKKYNDEQVEIIYRVLRNNKVLVQGPPGTGKSHTIANIISHLLATGNTVLVTAYTKRALKVLKEKIPDNISSLVVNFLGGDKDSLGDLESSVNAISEKMNNINFNKLTNKIKTTEKNLKTFKEKLSETENKLIMLREKDTRTIQINEKYNGKLIEISQKLESEFKQYKWFKDEIRTVEDIDSLARDILNLHNLFINKFKMRVYELEHTYPPNLERIISPEDFFEYLRITKKIKLEDKDRVDTVFLPNTNLIELKKIVKDQISRLIDLENCNNFDWSKRITKECLGLFWEQWNGKYEIVKKIIEDKEFENNIRNYTIKYKIQLPKDKSIQQIKSDALTIVKYLNTGKKITGFFPKILLPSEIKKRKYFFETILINGNLCNTKDNFKILLPYIDLLMNLQELDSIWKIDKINEPFQDRFYKFRNYFKELKKIVDITLQIKTNDAKLKKSFPNRINFDKVFLISLLKEIEYTLEIRTIKKHKNKIEKSVEYLSNKTLNQISLKLIKNIKELNFSEYEINYNKITNLKLAYKEYQEFIKFKNKVERIIPETIAFILSDEFDDSRQKEIKNAFFFKHARFYLKELINENSEQELKEEIDNLEKKISKSTEKLVTDKAWESLLRRLEKNPSLNQHLTAWKQAVTHIGRTGRGIRARRNIKTAKKEMKYCQEAIPAWVMPLYKVAETMVPEPGMFDYVIVDEASQLGPDAIFLLYISKKIIIVGDDKQTAPENIGVKDQIVTNLIKKHLNEIPFSEFYNLEFSFFAHASRFCSKYGNKISLREHFRCMPEIIEFSNSHWYRKYGVELYPLRQFSENRLKPLKNYFVSNGYVEGNGSNIRNEPEAKAIVNQIKLCINDHIYKGKSMGIIILQGYQQAALIEKLLIEEIGPKIMEERNIVCGRAASFQGDERDIIFLSLVTAQNHNRSSLVKASDERRFNVAASRAKDQLWLFHSVELDDLSNKDDLRYKLLSHFIQYKEKPIIKYTIPDIKRTKDNIPEPFDSWFEVDIYLAILEKGYDAIPQYKVGPYKIDLALVLKNGIKIAVECDGDKYHPIEKYRDDMIRQKILERCGWNFFRIRGSEFHFDRIKSLEPLWTLIVNLDDNNYFDETKKEDIQQNESSFNTSKLSEQNSETNVNESSFPKNNRNKLDIKKHKDTLNHTDILVFTDKQQVYKLKNNIGLFFEPEMLVVTENNENPIYICGTSNYCGYMLFGFKNGKIAKIPLKSYKTETNRKKLKNAYSNVSELIFIDFIEKDIDLVAISSIYKILVFNTKDIPEKSVRTSIGIRVQKQKNDSYMRELKNLNEVHFVNPDYYHYKIGAQGNSLRKSDKLWK